jgi:hypothetical protein
MTKAKEVATGDKAEKIKAGLDNMKQKAAGKYRRVMDKVHGVLDEIPFIGRISNEWREKIILTLVFMMAGQMLKNFIDDAFDGVEAEGDADIDADVASADAESDIDLEGGGGLDVADVVDNRGNLNFTMSQLRDMDPIDETFTGATPQADAVLSKMEELRQEYLSETPGSMEAHHTYAQMHQLKYKLLAMSNQSDEPIITWDGMEDTLGQMTIDDLAQAGIDINDMMAQNAEMGIDVSKMAPALEKALQDATATADAGVESVREFVQAYPNMTHEQLDGILKAINDMKYMRGGGGDAQQALYDIGN